MPPDRSGYASGLPPPFEQSETGANREAYPTEERPQPRDNRSIPFSEYFSALSSSKGNCHERIDSYDLRLDYACLASSSERPRRGCGGSGIGVARNLALAGPDAVQRGGLLENVFRLLYGGRRSAIAVVGADSCR